MHSPTSAKKVGIFFIVGMVILGAVTFRAEHLGRLFKKHNTYNAYFQSSKGVKKGAKVTLSGMDIGTVKKVVVEGDRLLIAMAIEKKIPIREGSVATIIPDFLFGKSYVDLNLVPPTRPVLPSGNAPANPRRSDHRGLAERSFRPSAETLIALLSEPVNRRSDVTSRQ